MSSNFQQSIYTTRFLTQWGFHRVQEHPKRSSLLSSILILIFLPFTCSLFIYIFTIHYYVFHYSLLRIHYSLLRIHYYVFIITYLLLRIYYSFTYLLFISLCTIHYLLFIRIHTYSLFYAYSYIFTISRDEIP